MKSKTIYGLKEFQYIWMFYLMRSEAKPYI